MTAVHVQLREDAELGRAWRRAEAALPPEWHIRTQSGAFGGGDGACAEAWSNMADAFEQEFGDTMTDALNALAESLEARRASEL